MNPEDALKLIAEVILTGDLPKSSEERHTAFAALAAIAQRLAQCEPSITSARGFVEIQTSAERVAASITAVSEAEFAFAQTLNPEAA